MNTNKQIHTVKFNKNFNYTTVFFITLVILQTATPLHAESRLSALITLCSRGNMSACREANQLAIAKRRMGSYFSHTRPNSHYGNSMGRTADAYINQRLYGNEYISPSRQGTYQQRW